MRETGALNFGQVQLSNKFAPQNFDGSTSIPRAMYFYAGKFHPGHYILQITSAVLLRYHELNWSECFHIKGNGYTYKIKKKQKKKTASS